jgi:hypothetical protein
MTPPLRLPEPRSDRLRPDQASGPRQVLTGSAPAPPEAAARSLWQMPPTAAACDLAFTRALVAASQSVCGLHQTSPHCGARSSTKPWR